MSIEDIMTKEVVSVSPDTKLIEVARILNEKQFHGLPVVKGGLVVGMITESDFLTKDNLGLHIPSLIKILNQFNAIGNKKTDSGKALSALIEADVRSAMNNEFVSIAPESSIADLIQIFNEKHVNPIPVVDGTKKLIGIVSVSDIIKLVSKFREEEIEFIEKS
jgi:CBS domain-containing protein